MPAAAIVNDSVCVLTEQRVLLDRSSSSKSPQPIAEDGEVYHNI
jgi:hypothetical protein